MPRVRGKQVAVSHSPANYDAASGDTIEQHVSAIDDALGGRQGFLQGLQMTWVDVDTVSVDDGVCVASNDAKQFIEVTSTLSADLSTTGVNGLDTGSRATETWYHLHVVKGSSGVGSLWSLSRTAPTLPAGYADASRWVGSFYNDASDEIRELVRIEGQGVERLFWLQDPAVDAKALDDGTGITFTDLDLSAYCPPTCRIARVIPHVQSPFFGPVCYFRMDGSTATLGQTAVGMSGQEAGSPIDVPLSGSQVVEYKLSDPVAVVDVYVIAYYLQIGAFE